MPIKRVVDTKFWTDQQVMDTYSIEDKVFHLYLLTNPSSSQLGIYRLPPQVISWETGYPLEVVQVLLHRFAAHYGVIAYDYQTQEIAVLRSLERSIIRGGRPVETLLVREFRAVESLALIEAPQQAMAPFWARSARPFDGQIANMFASEIARRQAGDRSVADAQDKPETILNPVPLEESSAVAHTTSGDNLVAGVNPGALVGSEEVPESRSLANPGVNTDKLGESGADTIPAEATLPDNPDIDTPPVSLTPRGEAPATRKALTTPAPQTDDILTDQQPTISDSQPLIDEDDWASLTNELHHVIEMHQSTQADQLQEVIACYERYHGPVTPAQQTYFSQQLSHFAPQQINQAIERAINARLPYAYLQGILANWRHPASLSAQ